MPLERKEARLRRRAREFDLRLEKSRYRDPGRPGYGGYILRHADTNFIVFGIGYWNIYDATLEEVEAELDRLDSLNVEH